ncbi:MAG TPA: RpiB/LacA/LacB family sugar-phosphate isomerase, partial [Propylenella sp.]|nr:RpiB/LacA/LacB family sugar-phosphate isomerase [Propylenella sp.]
MRIALAADHAGYVLKDELAHWLGEQGHEVEDLGTNGPDSVDYPEFGSRLARVVGSGGASRGIVVCGSGIGISIAVNRDPRCRCARVDDPLAAALAREHNDANVLALGAR